MTSTLLFFGDIVGNPGRQAVDAAVSELKRRYEADFVIANAENAAHGSGLTVKLANQILRSGVDVITSGDHIFRQRDHEDVVKINEVLRPANFPDAALGRGYGVYDLPNGKGKIAVINIIGRIFMEPVQCPFLTADKIIDSLRNDGIVTIFIDIHAEATSEKIAFARRYAGKVTAIIGTHTHVQTNDAEIFNGTAYLTDAGMCGPHDGVIGRQYEPVIRKMMTHMPTRFDVSNGDLRANGAAVRFDELIGKALSIQPLTFKLPNA